MLPWDWLEIWVVIYNSSTYLPWDWFEVFLEEIEEENTKTLNYAQVVTWVFGPTFSSDGVAR